jgi:2-isopropylmalate synthase
VELQIAGLELELGLARGSRRALLVPLYIAFVAEHCRGRDLLVRGDGQVSRGDEVKFSAAEGNGPINALALYAAPGDVYPGVRAVRLTAYKMRILDSDKGTAAVTRVPIDLRDGERAWTIVGGSTSLIEASWRTLSDSMEYALLAASGTLREAERAGLEGAAG